MEQILLAIQKTKVDAGYGKKKHANAADRKEKYHQYIGIALIVLNVLAVSALFYIITSTGDKCATITALLLSLLAVVLSWLQTFFNFQKDVTGHRRIGNKYLSVMKKCARLQAYLGSNTMKDEDIRKSVEDLGQEVDEINQEAEEYPTNYADYKKAHDGINNDEEEYTQKELAM
ncbi:MAG: SLATT domain-containing protein [Chlorobium sp.]